MATLVEENSSRIRSRGRPLDLATGGQQGAMLVPHQWESSAAHVRQKIIPVLVSVPGAYRYLPETENWIASLKSMMELMPQSISGLNGTESWEGQEVNTGHSGEKFTSVVHSTRTPSKPVYVWSEKYNWSIARFWSMHNRLLLQDPELGFPGITAIPEYINAGSPELLPRMTTFQMMFIEPDNTRSRAVNVWWCANMWGESGGEVVGSSEIQAASEIPEHTIEFNSFSLWNSSPVVEAGNRYMDALKNEDMRPFDLRPFEEGIEADVAAAQTGYADRISESVISRST